MDRTKPFLTVKSERFKEILRLLGTGNAAGVVALTSAIHSFADKPALIPLLKQSAVAFGVGVLTFAFGYLLFSIYHMTRHGEDWAAPKPRAPKPLSPIIDCLQSAWMQLVTILAIISTAAFFTGLIGAFIALLRF